MNITAAVVEHTGAPFALEQVELGELRDDEVLVRVAASGICHTDLICRDSWYPVPLPAVLGHEGAGVVERVGAGVRSVTPGDHVAMSYDCCGSCSSCAKGKGMYCRSFFEHNFAASRPIDGTSVLARGGAPLHAHFFAQSSFATYAVPRESSVVVLDRDVPLDVVAPFGCGIQTGAGSILNVLQPQPGSAVAIFGVGAVGLAAVLAARIAGCEAIFAVDLKPDRLELACELGATHAIDPAQVDVVETICVATGGGVAASLEATGSPIALRAAVDCLEPTGVCGVVGAPAFGTEVSLDVNTILTGGRVVRGIVEGESLPRTFLPRLVELWRDGSFPIDRIMTYYDFEQIDEAAADAEAGRTVKPVLRIG